MTGQGGFESSGYRDEDDYIKGLRAGLENSYREFDKLIITLSSGILALSVVFFERGGVGRHTQLLLAAWSALLSSVLSVAASLWIEQAHKKHLIEIDGRHDKRERRLFRVIGWLNAASGGTFLIGVVFLVIYLWSNVSGGG